jgi:hypothetical protein
MLELTGKAPATASRLLRSELGSGFGSSGLFSQSTNQSVNGIDIVNVDKSRHRSHPNPVPTCRSSPPGSSRRNLRKPQCASCARSALFDQSGERVDIARRHLAARSALNCDDAAIGYCIMDSFLLPGGVKESSPNHVLSDHDEGDSPDQAEQPRASRTGSGRTPEACHPGFPENREAAPHQRKRNQEQVLLVKPDLRTGLARPEDALSGREFRLDSQV